MDESIGNIPQVSPISNRKMDFIKNPKILMSFLYLLISSSIISLCIMKNTEGMFSSRISFIIGLGFMFVLGFIGAVILNFTTHILKIKNCSLSKAIAFTSLGFILSSIFVLIDYIIKIPSIITFILGIIIPVLFFVFIYQTKFFKSLGAYLLSLVFSAILFIGVSIIFILSGFSLMGNIIKTVNLNTETPVILDENTLNQTQDKLPNEQKTEGQNTPSVYDSLSDKQKAEVQDLIKNTSFGSVSPAENKMKEEVFAQATLQGYDAGIKSVIDGMRASSEIYLSSHDNNYGVSKTNNACINSEEDGFVHPIELINESSKIPANCVVSSSFPAKTFTITVPSITNKGYYCADQNYFSGLIDIKEGQFIAGVKCK